jgi:hypothetical protein
MQNMSAINRLWKQQQLPVKNALYFANGRSWEASLAEAAPSGYELANEFSLEEWLIHDPDYVSSFDVTRELQLPGQQGTLCCGEGSAGADGFAAHLSNVRELIWVMFLADSNPIVDISRQGKFYRFSSTNGNVLTINISSPEIPLRSLRISR